jgi:hypothetical protein
MVASEGVRMAAQKKFSNFAEIRARHPRGYETWVSMHLKCRISCSRQPVKEAVAYLGAGDGGALNSICTLPLVSCTIGLWGPVVERLRC